MIKKLKKTIFKLYALKTFFFPNVFFKGFKVLLYHDVDVKLFSEHIRFLTKHYNVISLEEMIKKIKSGVKLQNTFVITFDDGVKENFKLLETIIKYKIKPTIFLTGNINTKKDFWFNRYNQKELIGLLKLNNHQRLDVLDNNNNKERAALDNNEISQMKKFVDFQPHTITHPSLNKCTDLEVQKEIIDSCNMIERITKKKPIAFAPPFGIYDERVIRVLKQQEISCCLTIKPGTNINNNLYQVKRIGIPKLCDMNEFIIRVDGVWDKIRRNTIFKKQSSFYKQYDE